MIREQLSKLTPLAGLALLVTACSSDPEEPAIFDDSPDSKLCITKADRGSDITEESVTLEDGDSLTLHVGLFTVLHGEGPLVENHCSVALQEDVIEVHSYFEFGPRDEKPSGELSTPWHVGAECDVPTLEEGTYEVVHGDSSTSLSIPSDGNLDCGADVFEQL